MDPSHAQSRPPLGLSAGRRRGSNLVLGLFLLPGARRCDALLFSDFCRTVDDLADSPGRTINEKRDLLDAWLEALKPGHENALPDRLRDMIVRRDLDRLLLSEIVRGMLMDTELSRYATFEELRVYCQRVASAVGLTPYPTPTQTSPITGLATIPFYAKEAAGVAVGRIVGFDRLHSLE